MWEWESGAGCQSSTAKSSGGMSASTSARLGSTLCVTARPLVLTTIHCRSHLNPARAWISVRDRAKASGNGGRRRPGTRPAQNGLVRYQ